MTGPTLQKPTSVAQSAAAEHLAVLKNAWLATKDPALCGSPAFEDKNHPDGPLARPEKLQTKNESHHQT